MEENKKRIWELDALRGLFILCVIAVHIIFDLKYIFSVRFDLPDWYRIIADNGGILFVLISGICATFGGKTLRRGLTVFGAGMIITAITWILGIIDKKEFSALLILFGILHLLGTCMITYPIYRKAPLWIVAVGGVAIIAAGYYFRTLYAEFPLSYVFGIVPQGFTAGDYFPICPYLGWFMLGTVAGKTVYSKRTSLMPKVPENIFPLRFLRFCGRHSLLIYLIHQPIAYGILYLIFNVIK